jgi:DNA-binding MarR family transcriptional regulator
MEDVSRLRLAVMRLSRRLRQQAGEDITPSQLSVLSSVARLGPLSHGELAAAERVKAPTVTRIVDALEDAGLVARKVDPADKRCSIVELTADGRRRLEVIRSNRDAWLAKRMEALGAKERAMLERALPILERLVDDTEPMP